MVQVRPGFGRWRLVGLVAVLGWLVAAIWPVVTMSGWPLARIAFAALVPACAPPRSWRDRVPLLRLLQYLALAAVIPFGIALYAGNTLPTRYAILAGSLVLVWIVVAKWSAESELADAITKRLSYDINVYGRPGAALVDGSSLGRPATYDWSNSILETVVQRLPAAKLVHGARIRDLVTGHLILAGDRVALVAPASWPGGTYTIDQTGSIRRDGRPFDGVDPQLQEAVAAWRRRLKHATVRGFLVIRPESPMKLDPSPAGDLTLLPGDSAAEELTAWLLPGRATLDRRLLHDILYRAPLDLR